MFPTFSIPAMANSCDQVVDDCTQAQTQIHNSIYH